MIKVASGLTTFELLTRLNIRGVFIFCKLERSNVIWVTRLGPGLAGLSLSFLLVRIMNRRG